MRNTIFGSILAGLTELMGVETLLTSAYRSRPKPKPAPDPTKRAAVKAARKQRRGGK